MFKLITFAFFNDISLVVVFKIAFAINLFFFEFICVEFFIKLFMEIYAMVVHIYNIFFNNFI